MDLLIEDFKTCAIPNIKNPEYQKLLNDGTLCGDGRFGTIHRTQWDGQIVAIKTLNLQNSDSERQKSELQFHAQCNHPNIVRILAAGPDFPNHCGFYLMEYASYSSLNEVLHRLPDVHYTLAHAISWTCQAAQGADYLHRVCTPQLCHGDLKPANMLVFDLGRLIKLTDFGSAGPLSEKINQMPRPRTPVYAAPEIAYLKAGMPLLYTEKCDVYSLAISLWEFLARRRPFEDQGRLTFWNLFNRRPSVLCGCPEHLWLLCESGWAEDPNSRPTMLQIVKFLDFALQKLLLRSCAGLDPLPVPESVATFNKHSNQTAAGSGNGSSNAHSLT